MGLVDSKTKKCTKQDEHIEISDGIGGSERFCGSSKFEQPLKASKMLRDLFVTFKSSDSRNVERNGFTCQVTCADKTRA